MEKKYLATVHFHNETVDFNYGSQVIDENEKKLIEKFGKHEILHVYSNLTNNDTPFLVEDCIFISEMTDDKNLSTKTELLMFTDGGKILVNGSAK